MTTNLMESLGARCGVDVSVIMPVYNAEKWLEASLRSLSEQTFAGTLELSMYNDGSTDSSMLIIDKWTKVLQEQDIKVTIHGHKSKSPKGVGYAKNMSIKQSRGNFLCFFDADDLMLSGRIQKQFEMALNYPNAIIGCRFNRDPVDSTKRYTQWANRLTETELYTQIYTSHGPTVIMPTWFCSRTVFDNVGGFDEGGKGTPEDLIFFYKHLSLGGRLTRVDECLLTYRYHPEATTFSVHEDTIWNIRVKAIEERVLQHWDSFTVWNAGKQGRKFYRSLSEENRDKVIAFCDVDQKKISKGYYVYEESIRVPKPKIPILHFTKAVRPFVICVKQDLTGGNFEENLQSLSLTEGRDYFHFN